MCYMLVVYAITFVRVKRGPLTRRVPIIGVLKCLCALEKKSKVYGKIIFYTALECSTFKGYLY